MSALREWAASKGGDAHKAVAVNALGKWKTACQVNSPLQTFTKWHAYRLRADLAVWLSAQTAAIQSVCSWLLGTATVD